MKSIKGKKCYITHNPTTQIFFYAQSYKQQFIQILNSREIFKYILICFLLLYFLCISYFAASVVQSLSRIWLFATPWTVAHHTPLFMGFSRQEYWSGLHFLLQGSSWTRDWTHVSCIGRQIVYHWTTKKAHFLLSWYLTPVIKFWWTLRLVS